MIFTWDANSVKWFLDASVYTEFHKKLAEKIETYLLPSDTLLDAGCGLGRLDLELSPHVAEITAADINELVTDRLRQDVSKAGIKNMQVETRDLTDIGGMYDVIMTCFYGQHDNTGFLKHIRRRFIRIVSAGNKSHLYPERHRINTKKTVPLVEDELRSLGISYELELCSIEFGQPLVSWEDAQQFVKKNAPNAEIDEIDEFLKSIVTYTGREDFPIYLPYQKQLGIFIIDK